MWLVKVPLFEFSKFRMNKLFLILNEVACTVIAVVLCWTVLATKNIAHECIQSRNSK